ncbi:MAG: hypothetical protein ACR2RB_09340, partial [Gammaproteobacteria bacterium]
MPVTTIALTLFAGAVAVTDFLAPVLAADGPRGQLLYENHCHSCHESIIHVREQRVVDSIEALEQHVARWVSTLGLSWSPDDIADVERYLDEKFYHFG